MPIKYIKHCKTCKRIKGDLRKRTGPFLIDRIYKSRQWVKGGEPLTEIWESYGGEKWVSYLAFRNHCMKHQAPDEESLMLARAEKITKDAQAVQVKEVIRTEQVRNEVIDKAMEALANGDLKLTATHLLKAAKDQDDVEAKRKDQSIALMRMVNAYQSGELSGPIEGELIE